MNRLIIAVTGFAGLAAAAFFGAAASAEHAVPIPPPAHDVPAAGKTQTAVLAGGCFWGMEAVFERVKGVKSVTAGYAGGSADTATYDGGFHRDAPAMPKRSGSSMIQASVSYGTLLRVYFSVAHDPTELNRQGPDSGPSYRSAIFPQNAAQRQVAAAYIAQLAQDACFQGADRDEAWRPAPSIRPRPIISISSTAIRIIPISCSGTSPRSPRSGPPSRRSRFKAWKRPCAATVSALLKQL